MRGTALVTDILPEVPATSYVGICLSLGNSRIQSYRCLDDQ